MSLFISDAYAQTGSTTSSLMQLLPIVAIFVVFYFLLIRPQQKRAKEHKAMVAAIAKGDEVLTAGGFLAKVTNVGEGYITAEIADGVSVKVQASAVTQVLPKGTVKSA